MDVELKRVLYDPFLPPLRLSTGGEKVRGLEGGLTELLGEHEWRLGGVLRWEASLGEEGVHAGGEETPAILKWIALTTNGSLSPYLHRSHC